MPAVGCLAGALVRVSTKHNNILVSRLAHSSHIDCAARGMAAQLQRQLKILQAYKCQNWVHRQEPICWLRFREPLQWKI